MSIATRSSAIVHYVSMHDAAVVEGVEWFSTFLRTLSLDDIPIKPGETPTVFHLKRLSRREYQRIGVGADAMALSPIQQNEVVAFGLKDVKGYGGDDFPIGFVGTGERERLNDETLDRLYAPELFMELATVIVKLSSLSPLGKTR